MSSLRTYSALTTAAVLLCLSLSAAPSHAQLATATMVVTESSDGTTVHLSKGEILFVRLNANPSTGYSWRFCGGLHHLVLVSKIYQPAERDPGALPIVGAPGHDRFEFRANSSGIASLRLCLYPPARHSKPAGSFYLRAIIRR
ncbi:MAG: protease inhibitor I42 family protein [Armatimonadota bacterium]|nr:protease inhibitor I42 family protein [Armatimonadota bacterium]